MKTLNLLFVTLLMGSLVGCNKSLQSSGSAASNSLSAPGSFGAVQLSIAAPSNGVVPVAVGATLDLAVTVTTTNSIQSYAWQKLNTTTNAYANLSSQTSDLLVLSDAQTSMAGTYRVQVVIANGTATQTFDSNSVVVTVGGQAAPTPTPPSTTSGTFGIKVSGNKLVSTQTGQVVNIVGSNISGLEGRSSTPFSATTVATWQTLLTYAYGTGTTKISQPINAIRIPLGEAPWLGYDCINPLTGVMGNQDPNKTYQGIVEQTVANATAAGLYVILDLHWGAPNNAAGVPYCPLGQPSYADADHSIAFWTSVATTFKNNPAVIFELFNEPFGDNIYANYAGNDSAVLLNGGNFTPFLYQNNANNNTMEQLPGSFPVAGMQAMLNAVRATGATNVVLSSPIGWAGEIEYWLQYKPTDSIGQLGVAWHVYGYNKGTSYPLAVLNAGYPIVITETYGLNAIDGYSWATSENIGYMWWGWNDWAGQSLSSEFLSQPPWYESTTP